MNRRRTYQFIFSFGVLTLVTLLAPAMSIAQNAKAFARLDTTAIMIGDQVGLELGITVPEDFTVSWPALADTISDHIEIVSTGENDTSHSQGNMLLTRSLKITSFDSGYFELPPFHFTIAHSNDTNRFLVNTNSQYLMVNVPAVDTSQAFKIIKGPVEEPVTFGEILPWLLIGIVVLTVVALTIWYIRRRRQNKPVFVRKPKKVLPPAVLAIQKLEELRLAKLWQQGKLKEYYTYLTDIIREYFDGRFNVDAMEMTSDEILESLRNKEINKEAMGKLHQVLQTADFVKFAKAHPTPLENDLCLNHCIDFVKETKPAEVVEKQNNGEMAMTAGKEGE